MLKDFKEYMKFLESCCLQHPENYNVDEIVSVDEWTISENDGPSGGAIFKFKDGTWGAMEESQDYTGHGCQCNSSFAIFDNKKDAIRLGLSTEVKERLGYK